MSEVYSMTGYARVSRPEGETTLTVTIKSVNHRFLDPRWQVPADWEPVVAQLEPRLRRVVRRGHLDIRCSCDRAAAGGLHLDANLVNAYLAAHAELSQRLQRPEAPQVADILRVPGVLSAAAAPAPALPPEFIAAVFDEALAALNQMRRQEGAALAADLHQRCRRLETAATAVAALRQPLADALLARLRTRIQALLEKQAPSPERLLQEAGLLAERNDISEELTRLEVHRRQFEALLEGGGEVGKKLDFLAQELHREVNTLLSKTTGALDPALGISEHGLALKAEVEKIREQVQNLE